MNILDAFAARVAEHPERVAIVDGRGRPTSYAELDRRSAALAAAWTKAGLKRDDRVLLALRVDADLYAALAALWRIGAAAVFPEPALGLGGLRHAVEATRPRAFLANGAYRLLPWIAPAIRRIPLHLSLPLSGGAYPAADLPADTPALISFTSGSTGAPKAIVRSHGCLQAQGAAVAPLLASDRAEVDLVAFPVFVVANLGRGVTSVLPNWRLSRPLDADARAVARHAERAGVTRLLLSPALAELLADHLPPSVDTLFVGGGPVFPDLLDRLRERRPALRIVAVYGSTEAEPIAELDWAHATATDGEAMRAGAGLLAGHVVAAARVRIVDEEIQVAGEHVVQGYLDPARDASTKVRDADGTVWHRTGDAGRFDAQGRLWLLGRVEGRVGALRPFPVEAAARTWPGVRRAALVGVNDRAVLAVEGDAAHLPDWRTRFKQLGGAEVEHIPAMPLDRRHGSKVDLATLRAMLKPING